MKVFLDGIWITFCETMRYFVDINPWQPNVPFLYLMKTSKTKCLTVLGSIENRTMSLHGSRLRILRFS